MLLRSLSKVVIQNLAQVDDSASSGGGNGSNTSNNSNSGPGNSGLGNSTSSGNGNIGSGSGGVGAVGGNGNRTPTEPLNDIEKYLNIRRQVRFSTGINNIQQL